MSDQPKTQPRQNLLVRLGFTAHNNLEREVVDRFENREMITQADSEADTASFGQRLADRVASFGGSWTFIMIFGSILILWVLTNAYFLSSSERFDPYPFVFLNLILSMLAAFQAPIIMMSQNRQTEKDRIQSQLDYQINLKAELEILQLQEKLDLMQRSLDEIKSKLDK